MLVFPGKIPKTEYTSEYEVLKSLKSLFTEFG